ncbi:hypothetical protein SteCoe_35647 [Stentor coeruleus]|uniref:Uncharacterized protein n=1 Tax=Stentor coeruleus TaxID=5963 RepID=A0A1R2AS14_9CILI|nr:hypothetical protein SteCoe_35647 [Stentor coeruleus]
MFLNTAPRTPFENRTNGTNRNSFKGRPDKQFKRDPKPRTRSIKDAPKKSDEMNSQQKNVLKDFMKSLKDLENEGFKTVLYYLHDNIYVLPCSIHWQVFMELADLAKRENRIEDARKLLEISVKLQPSAHQAWL